MTKSEGRILPWRVEHTLVAGFFLIILLGFLGYYQTVRAMQASAHRSHRIETSVSECVSLAKDVALSSHETSFFTQAYVYGGDTGDRSQGWEAEGYTEASFDSLQADIKKLPGSAVLQAECLAAERQNRELCDPQEVSEIRLTDRGHAREAQRLLQTEGTARRDNLEIQLDDLVGVNPTQYPDAARPQRLPCAGGSRREPNRASGAPHW